MTLGVDDPARRLARALGPRSPLARGVVETIAEELARRPRSAALSAHFARWERAVGAAHACGRRETSSRDGASVQAVFARQAFVALVATSLVERASGDARGGVVLGADDPTPAVREALAPSTLDALDRVLGELDAEGDEARSSPWRDRFRDLARGWTPASARRALGAFQTPGWLADLAVESLGDAGGRVLDPTCGTGSLLLRSIARRLGGARDAAAAQHVIDAHVGLERDPLTAHLARANVLAALISVGARLDDETLARTHSAIRTCDALETLGQSTHASRSLGRFEAILANPPWVRWSQLSPGERSRLAPRSRALGVTTEDQFVGGLDGELATLVVHAALRHRAPGARIALILPFSLLQSRSGRSFRRRLASEAAQLTLERVVDLGTLRPFEDITARTALVVLGDGASPLVARGEVWSRPSASTAVRPTDALDVVRRSVRIEPAHVRTGAGRGGDPAGPWTLEASPPSSTRAGHSPSSSAPHAELAPTLARKGTTTDFNNVFWVRVLAVEGARALVENAQSELGHRVPRRTFWVESALLHPLARGADWSALREGRAELPLALLLPHEARPPHRTLDDAGLAEAPLAHAYLTAHVERACIGCRASAACRVGLRGRSTYAIPKYRAALGTPWGVWNVGAYTFAPYKVAWREVATRFEVAVLGSAPLGGSALCTADGSTLAPRPIVPDHKLMFVPFDDADAAWFLAGLLRSAPLRALAERSSSSTSRGTRLFEHVALPRFDRADAEHVAFARDARASSAAHLDDGLEQRASALLERVSKAPRGQLGSV